MEYIFYTLYLAAFKIEINDALLIDNTGVFKNKETLSKHLELDGISKVLLTAPAKDDIKNIVHGINNDIINTCCLDGKI